MEGIYNRDEALNALMQKLSDPANKGVLLVGAGGSGKTTLLARYFSDAARRKDLVVAVSVPRASYPEELVDLVGQELDDAVAEWQSPNPKPLPSLLSQQMKVGRRSGGYTWSSIRTKLKDAESLLGDNSNIIFIFDGLDESNDPDQAAIVIEDFVRNPLPRLKVIVSSRNSINLERLRRSQRFDTVEIQNLSPVEANSFVRSLISSIAVDDEVVAQIVAVAGGNPLLLQLLSTQLELGWLPERTSVRIIDYIRSWWDHALRSAVSRGMSSHDIERLVLLVAIHGPVSINSLATLARSTRKQLVNQIHMLGPIFSLSESHNDQTVNIVHNLIREFILTELAQISDIRFSELEFGAEDAERDRQLEQHFITRPAISEIVLGRRSIVLGDRGSGKSAIFEYIKKKGTFSANSIAGDIPADDQLDLLVLSEDDPSTFINSTVDPVKSDHSAERFKAAWLLYVSSLIATKTSEFNQAPLDREFDNEAAELLKSVGWNKKTRVSQTLLYRLKSFAQTLSGKATKLTIGPISFESKVDQNGGKNESKRILDIANFISRTDKILSRQGKRVLILVDRVDEVFKYNRKTQEQLVQGLMLAEAYVSLTSRIRLVVLLRTDLFEIYDIQEKNKFTSRTARLEWSELELFELMYRRLFANRPLRRIAELLQTNDYGENPEERASLRIAFPEYMEGSSFRTWLFTNLANGNGRVSPRQIILFLILARDLSVDNEKWDGEFPIFKQKVLRDSMTQLSELSYGEVVNDFRVATSFVKNCRAGKLKEFTLAEVKSLFDISEGSVSGQIELLERLGFLQRLIDRNEGILESRFRVPKLFTRCWEIPSEL